MIIHDYLPFPDQEEWVQIEIEFPTIQKPFLEVNFKKTTDILNFGRDIELNIG